jgi:hypothetical protein
MRVNDMTEFRLNQIDVLERVRELLIEVERARLPDPLSERVFSTRLFVDREIEELR